MSNIWTRQLVDAIGVHASKLVNDPGNNLPTNREYLATWLATEAADANLSQVLLQGGSLCRFVPKMSHVTGLVSGDIVIVRGSGPGRLYIAGKLVGDITKSSLLTDHNPPSGVGTVTFSSVTSTSAIASWSAATDDDAVAGYEVFVNNAFRAFTPATSYTLTGLSGGTTYSVRVHAKDRAGNIGAESTSTLLTAAGPATGTFTSAWHASWSGSYNFQGHNEFDSWFGNSCYQGQNTGANQRSLIGFNSASITSVCGGATINACKVKLTFAHWWSNSGGTAVIGTSGAGSRPGSWSGSANRVQSGGWPRGGTRYVSLGTGIGAEFAAGSTKALCLGPGPSGSTQYYGYAYGAGSGIYTPVLYITYTI